MQDIDPTPDKVLDYLSASSYAGVTNIQIWSGFLWLKLFGIFGVVSFL